MTLGIVLFVLALTFSIALHELGHLATAKRFGMKATQYFIGFGPTLWSTRRGETEYGVKALPLGGFVKIIGMTRLEDLDPTDEPRAFYRQKASRRAIVLVAGSTMHFILAYVLLVITFLFVGLPVLTTRIAAVTPCVTQADPAACTSADPASPALAAGLQPGDRVVSFDGAPVTDWGESFTARIRAHIAGPARITVERDGARREFLVSLQRVQRSDPDAPGGVREISALGLQPLEVRERASVFAAPWRAVTFMGTMFRGTGQALVQLPGQIPDAVRSAFNGEERDPATSPVGLVGAGRLSGEAVREGAAEAFLGLLAGFNVFIGVMNLLPLLPLDGGHIAILGFEESRKRVARLRRRPDPGPVDLRKLLPATYAVIAMFVGLTLLLLYADIVNPIANPFQ